MADPLSLVALGAAVGGAAGKFVEKAWNSGEKWITSYFADHRPKAIAQAQANSAEFLTVQSSRPAYGGPLTFGVSPSILPLYAGPHLFQRFAFLKRFSAGVLAVWRASPGACALFQAF